MPRDTVFCSHDGVNGHSESVLNHSAMTEPAGWELLITDPHCPCPSRHRPSRLGIHRTRFLYPVLPCKIPFSENMLSPSDVVNKTPCSRTRIGSFYLRTVLAVPWAMPYTRFGCRQLTGNVRASQLGDLDGRCLSRPFTLAFVLRVS